MTRPHSHWQQTTDEHIKRMYIFMLEPRISGSLLIVALCEASSVCFVTFALQPFSIPASALNFRSIKFTNLLSFLGWVIYSRCGVHDSDSAAACFIQMQSVLWGSFNIGGKKMRIVKTIIRREKNTFPRGKSASSSQRCPKCHRMRECTCHLTI